MFMNLIYKDQGKDTIVHVTAIRILSVHYKEEELDCDLHLTTCTCGCILVVKF